MAIKLWGMVQPGGSMGEMLTWARASTGRPCLRSAGRPANRCVRVRGSSRSRSASVNEGYLHHFPNSAMLQQKGRHAACTHLNCSQMHCIPLGLSLSPSVYSPEHFIQQEPPNDTKAAIKCLSSTVVADLPSLHNIDLQAMFPDHQPPQQASPPMQSSSRSLLCSVDD